ncbi:MAG: hypothetical protein HOW73_05400 [Polyangiaceae bacterium]|nr:hypothetical protein [Polyangiaceae bacterium]
MNPRALLLPASVVFGLSLFGCGSKEAGASGSASASAEASKPAKASAAASASAPPVEEKPADPPTLAAIKAGSWKDPGGGPDIKLADTALDKCYGFKGYSMKLPEGTKLETLVGARACAASMPGAKNGEYRLIVLTDEVKVDFGKKADIDNIKSKPFDDPDAFLYEVENKKGEKYYRGWFEKKLGKWTVRCNPLLAKEGQVLTFDQERAVLELCRTLTYAEPAKK